MEKKGEMTADFLKEEEKMRKSAEWREVWERRHGWEYARTWLTPSSRFLKSTSK